MQILDKDKFRQQLFDHYCARFSDYKDSHDPQLIDEALTLLEDHFRYTNEDEVMGRDRFCAVPYLALMVAKELLSEE